MHNFAALRQLKQDTLSQDAARAIPWKLEISLRSDEANELYSHYPAAGGQQDHLACIGSDPVNRATKYDVAFDWCHLLLKQCHIGPFLEYGNDG